MRGPNIVPKDKTLKELVFEVGNASCHCNKFIEINKFGIKAFVMTPLFFLIKLGLAIG